MYRSDFVYLDVRWRESGWLEAIRLRLAGWLPEHLAAQGVEKGVLETFQQADGRRVSLTARGLALTEPGQFSFTNENFWQLAELLRNHDYGNDWLHAAGEDAVRGDSELFDAVYRLKLLAYLHPDNISGSS